MGDGKRASRPRGLPWLACLGLAGACRPAPAPAPAPAALRVAVHYDAWSLDPHSGTNFTGTLELLSNVYEPLVQLDALGRVQPALASSWTTPRETVLRLRLRPGVRFHGGRALTSADVVYSLERARAAPLEARYYVSEIVAVEAPGPLEVELRLRRPSPALLSRLSFVMIVPAGSEAEWLATHADGTGPYRVTGFEPHKHVSLVRNEAWWGGRAVFPGAGIDLDVDAAQAAAALVAGRYQVATLGGGLGAGLVEGSPRHKLVARDSVFVTYLGFDLAHARTPYCPLPRNPLLDERVRRAIDLGLDRQRLAERIPGRARPAWQLVPREVFGFDPRLDARAADPGAARALLREAGLAGGFALGVHGRPSRKEAVAAVVEALAPLGIDARMELLPEQEYFEAIDEGRLSAWVDTWGCTTGEAGELFENAFHTRDPAAGLGEFNETGLSDTELDRDIEASLEQPGGEERRLQLQGLMRRAMRLLAWVPLYTGQGFYAFERGLAWKPQGRPLRLVDVSPE